MIRNRLVDLVIILGGLSTLVLWFYMAKGLWYIMVALAQVLT